MYIIFHLRVRFNHLRHASLYTDHIRKLSEGHPDTYEIYMAGHFVIKECNITGNKLSRDPINALAVFRANPATKACAWRSQFLFLQKQFHHELSCNFPNTCNL